MTCSTLRRQAFLDRDTFKLAIAYASHSQIIVKQTTEKVFSTCMHTHTQQSHPPSSSNQICNKIVSALNCIFLSTFVGFFLTGKQRKAEGYSAGKSKTSSGNDGQIMQSYYADLHARGASFGLFSKRFDFLGRSNFSTGPTPSTSIKPFCLNFVSCLPFLILCWLFCRGPDRIVLQKCHV